MTRKSAAAAPPPAAHPAAPAGRFGTAGVESWAELGSAMASFINERIREDVRTQHAMLHAGSPSELHSIEADFMQKAIDRSSAETGKRGVPTGDRATTLATKSARKT
jgi:hypothetical protein